MKKLVLIIFLYSCSASHIKHVKSLEQIEAFRISDFKGMTVIQYIEGKSGLTCVLRGASEIVRVKCPDWFRDIYKEGTEIK